MSEVVGDVGDSILTIGTAASTFVRLPTPDLKGACCAALVGPDDRSTQTLSVAMEKHTTTVTYTVSGMQQLQELRQEDDVQDSPLLASHAKDIERHRRLEVRARARPT